MRGSYRTLHNIGNTVVRNVDSNRTESQSRDVLYHSMQLNQECVYRLLVWACYDLTKSRNTLQEAHLCELESLRLRLGTRGGTNPQI